MKYFENDEEDYYNSLECNNCSNNNTNNTLIYSRTVSNGEVWYCKLCKTENVTLSKPNEDDY